MDYFDTLEKSGGGYIFLSHSHDDILQVREIRNRLEKSGFEPLCFYLKCLTDDSEVEDLIKREIDAREWFVFLNSENSRKSKWVTLEREYISTTGNKKILTIDLDSEESIENVLHKITHKLRVFLSASTKDAPLVRRIQQRLSQKDYLTFYSADIPCGADFLTTVVSGLREASQDGCVLLLLTPEAANSRMVLNELDYVTSRGGNLMPVLVGMEELENPMLRFYLSRYQLYHLSATPTDEEIDDMIELLGREILSE